MDFLSQIFSNESHFPYLATVALVLGFIVATVFGSIAWYNSKRPAGWENKDRPDIIPSIEK